MTLESDISDENALTIVIDKDYFANFVLGIIGPSQSYMQQFSIVFELGPEEIEDLHNLINQRVGEQNGAILAAMSAFLLFEDSKKYEFTSIIDLCSFAFRGSELCEQLYLSWTFLIPFGDDPTPKAQKVEILFDRRTYDKDTLRKELAKHNPFPHRQLLRDVGNVEARITSNSRTWVEDIASILERYVNQSDKTTEYINIWTKITGWIAGSSIVTLIAFFLWSTYRQVKIDEKAEISKLLLNVDPNDIGALSQYYQVINIELQHPLFVVGAVVLGTIIFIASISISILLFEPWVSTPKSFLLFSDTCRNKLAASRNRFRSSRKILISAAGLAAAFFVGLLVNFISRLIF